MLKKLPPDTQETDKEFSLWKNWKALIANGAVTPFISNALASEIFGGIKEVATSWAADQEINSPFSKDENCNLPRVAQYYSVTKNDLLSVKQDYLKSLNEFLLALAFQNGDEIGEIKKKIASLSFSDIAHELGYPRYAGVKGNPLRLLAQLPLPIYITTCHHNFLEVTLSEVGKLNGDGRKEPVSEIFYWNDALNYIPSIYDKEPNYTPTPDRPLVYHLYGIDKYPDSIVLTEDDYLDCLARLAMLRSTPTLPDDTRNIPADVKIAVGGRSLLLLGYNVHDWEFRVLYRGLIQATRETRESRQIPKSISMQIEPKVDDDSIKNLPASEQEKERERQQRIKCFLETYFSQSKFDVYWGSIEACVAELYRIYQEND